MPRLWSIINQLARLASDGLTDLMPVTRCIPHLLLLHPERAAYAISCRWPHARCDMLRLVTRPMKIIQILVSQVVIFV